MNLTQLAEEVSIPFQTSPETMRQILVYLFDVIKGVSHAGERVTIQEFGYFEAVPVMGRSYTLPSGRKIETMDRLLLKFYSSDIADNEMNEPIHE